MQFSLSQLNIYINLNVIFRAVGMCAKSFERYARSTITRKEYKERANQKTLRGMLTGRTKIPKYPDMQFRPESKLYGLQNIGKISASFTLLTST